MPNSTHLQIVNEVSSVIAAYNTKNRDAINAGLMPVWEQSLEAAKKEAAATASAKLAAHLERINTRLTELATKFGAPRSYFREMREQTHSTWRQGKVVGVTLYIGSTKIGNYRFCGDNEPNWVKITAHLRTAGLELAAQKKVEAEKAARLATGASLFAGYADRAKELIHPSVKAIAAPNGLTLISEGGTYSYGGKWTPQTTTHFQNITIDQLERILNLKQEYKERLAKILGVK